MANDKNTDTSSESSEASCEASSRSGSPSPASISAQPLASQIPETCEIGSNGKPVPTIKLQRKCASHWTCSSDLPRFNWLELKLSQQTSPSDSQPSDRCDSLSPTATLGPTKSVEMIPLKRRRLECAASGQLESAGTVTVRPAEDNVLNECRLPLKKRTDLSLSTGRENRVVSTTLKVEDVPTETSSDVSSVTAASKWPLKKRIISPVSPDESGPPSPVRNGTEKVNRGPVICKNLVLPPTPPSSSAPTESPDEVQEEPLDLSRAVLTLECASKSNPINECVDESSNEVQIISVTKLIPSQPEMVHKEVPRRPELVPARPMTNQHQQMFTLNRVQSGILSSGHGAFKAVQRTPPTSLAPLNDHHRKDERMYLPHVTMNSMRDHRRTILPKENPMMTARPVTAHAPFPHPPTVQPDQWNPIHFRPHQVNRSHNDSNRPLVRPFALPTTRMHPVRYTSAANRTDERWGNQQSAGLIRNKSNGNGQSEVEVLSPSSSFAVPRFFRPKDALSSTTFAKKINNPPSTSISATPMTRPTIPTFNPSVTPANWPPSSFRCNVCLEVAGFKCAGCHLYAYCSTDCQAKDWPLHSRMCRVSS